MKPATRVGGVGAPGLTLIELLVVMAVVAALVTLLFPAFQRSTESARATACSHNLQQIGVGLNLYLADHNMIMPELKALRASTSDDVPVIDNTLNSYVQSAKAFACPSDPKYAAASGTSYYWNTALNGQSAAALKFLNLTDDHTRIPILADKEGFHPYLDTKVNVLYADGHATKDLKFWDGAQ